MSQIKLTQEAVNQTRILFQTAVNDASELGLPAVRLSINASSNSPASSSFTDAAELVAQVIAIYKSIVSEDMTRIETAMSQIMKSEKDTLVVVLDNK